MLVHNKYKFSEYLCRDYLTDESHTDFSVCADEKEILLEIQETNAPINAEYAESVCIHRAIAEHLAEYDAFLLHSAFIECEGVGVAFAAKSGVGKSTHISIWQRVFGDKVRVINGDKPIVRLINGEFYGYGTPWLGKENIGKNGCCKLKALCFLNRGEKNAISIVSAETAAMMLFSQIYLPSIGENAAKTLELVDKFSSSVSFFKLYCNMQDEAAKVSHNAIIKGE